LLIFEQHFSPSLFCKIKKYTTSNQFSIRTHLNWESVKQSLDQSNLDTCRQQLLTLLSINNPVHENHVHIFHIKENHLTARVNEPNPKNTTKMVYKMLVTIYQRNILATLVKYILLKPLIDAFTTSKLIPEKKGIFYSILKRLWELIFECVLLSFNGSNYDNYLLCNSLITILTHLNEKITIFKKGASISTVVLTVKKNFMQYRETSISKKKKGSRNKWQMKLYLKDVRNLVSANMTLDKIGKLFNLEVAKLAFPYEQARSILTLKSIHSLRPTDDDFWHNTFSGRSVCLTNRLEAQQTYNKHNFKNLYEFSVYYLKCDCMLLHNIILILFQNYLLDKINIVTRRIYSQSKLGFEQFFICEPAKQLNKILAPKLIDNTFYNHFLKQAVTGGLCTSFVHGKIDRKVIINEIFNYLEQPCLNPRSWPNFSKLPSWNRLFNQTPSGISTIDIRSLYPSASVKKIPVGQPLFFTRFTRKDHTQLYDQNKFYRVLNIKQYCANVRLSNCSKTDVMQLISEHPKSINEFNALNFYLKSVPDHVDILRFQSGFTAFGQLMLVNFPIDGFLVYRENETLHLKLIQYQSAYFHGHRSTCCLYSISEDREKTQNTSATRQAIHELCSHYIQHFNSFFERKIEIEYVEIFDCDFPHHQVPKDAGQTYLPFFRPTYDYPTFIQKLHAKKLTGLLAVKNLKIAKHNQTPMMGFIIHRLEYGPQHLSPYTQNLATKIDPAKRVVAVHAINGYIVISTEYYNWLRESFGFAEEPSILHALIFQLDDYLRKSIESKLTIRQSLKNLIKTEQNPLTKQNYEVKAELIKLMLNSCYGYTLCNLTSKKFKQFENRQVFPQKTDNIVTCVQLSSSVFFVQTKKTPKELFSTMLGHVGCYILFNSKIILLKRLYFLLKFLDPRLAQLLYMDTDSAHFLVKNSKFEDNVDKSLKLQFLNEFDKHFDTGKKISGIWVQEGFFELGEYLGEKCYRLYNDSDSHYITHMKGLSSFFQKQFHENNVNPKKTPFLSYNNFYKTSDFLIFKCNMSKNLFDNYIPNKRYFVSATGSLPLHIE
jgi:hypothetical protein